jgi:hypothetical protein
MVDQGEEGQDVTSSRQHRQKIEKQQECHTTFEKSHVVFDSEIMLFEMLQIDRRS